MALDVTSYIGKSTGNARHTTSLCVTYRIASTMSRRSCFSRRPSFGGRGSNGAAYAHSTSDISKK